MPHGRRGAAASRACRHALSAALALAVGLGRAAPAAAQQPEAPARRDSAQAPATDTARAPQIGPPITPRRAFLYSVLVPGYGQAVLDRPQAGAIFVAVEALSLAMAGKAAGDLRIARRHADDSIVVRFETDPATGAPRPVLGPSRYTRDLLNARRTHLEDWIALLIFNHLFAGAEAFVAAHLWDLPVHVSTRPGGGTAVSARLSW